MTEQAASEPEDAAGIFRAFVAASIVAMFPVVGVLFASMQAPDAEGNVGSPQIVGMLFMVFVIAAPVATLLGIGHAIKTRKKIALAVIAGCAMATAIAWAVAP